MRWKTHFDPQEIRDEWDAETEFKEHHPTIREECEADRKFWEQQRYDFDKDEAIEKRAQAILIAEYDRRLGPNAWAASGNKFPENLTYCTRSELKNKVYELRHGHPLPKVRWKALCWAALWTAGSVAYFVYERRIHPEEADLHGFRLAVTVFIAAIFPVAFLMVALIDFYPLRERRLDKLIAWHAKSPIFIVFFCLLFGAALISGGTRGLGWLLLVGVTAYVAWYFLLALAVGVTWAGECFLELMEAAVRAAMKPVWYLLSGVWWIVNRVWKIFDPGGL